MTKNIFYISDFFAEEIVGGGELNDQELINLLKNEFILDKYKSNIISEDVIKNNKEAIFIISNFINLSDRCKEYLQKNCKYIIYEHDHKYLKSRNPGLYPDFKAPQQEIINEKFYLNAKKVICQSKFHLDIIKKNLDINNLINISGNLWSVESLDLLRNIGKNKKKERCSIMNSSIKHKNTLGAIRYCKIKGREYKLIENSVHSSFIRDLGSSSTFVFFPETPETLSRIVVEARMLGMKTITSKNIGAIHEEWFSLKGEELIEYMTEKRGEILNKIIEVINE